MKTKDIYFTAFLIDQNIRPINYTKQGHMVEFEFDLPETAVKEMKLDYLHSKFNDVKTIIEKIKGLY